MPTIQHIILAYNRLATTGYTAFITISAILKPKVRSQQLYFTEHTQDASAYTLVYCYDWELHRLYVLLGTRPNDVKQRNNDHYMHLTLSST